VHIENHFTVSPSVDETWKVLLDVEGIVPCMPGAEILDLIDDGFAGSVKVKLGAIVAKFKGTVRFTELDEEAHRIVLHASGREMKGQGNATADVTVALTSAGSGTDVAIETELAISGKIVQ
jgi:carbon monoxide dehydrogenase subunit G